MIFNRPWLVIVQFVSVIGFSVVSWIRFGSALSLWDFLSSLPLAVTPAYQVISGLFWGLAGLWVGAWLWKGNSNAPKVLRILSVTYALYYWIEQFALMTSKIRQTNWLFLAIVTVILVLFVFLSFRASGVKAFFGENHE